MAIGMFLVWLATLGPLSRTQHKINQLIEIDSSEVNSIIVQPTQIPSEQKISLVNSEVVVNKRTTIDDLCLALHHAVVTDENFLKRPENVCRVLILLKHENIVFGIRMSGPSTSIELDSKGESGWHYAKLQANEFGQMIRELCK